MNFVQNREIREVMEEVRQGNAHAMNNLGHMYEHGLGVEVNYDEARSLYREAVERGHVDAMNRLAHMYEHGLGVEVNYDEARSLYREARHRGNDHAMNDLRLI